jgi:hypothetical protein
MADANNKQRRDKRVSAGGMLAIVGITLASLGLCVGWVALLASDTLVAHALSGTEYGMGAAYGAVFVTAAASIALLFKLLVRKAGS